jgi:CRISPR system Cascade subunit CasE
MYLSRLILDTRSSQVRRDLSDCQDLHRTIMRAYPQADTPARRAHGVLYRLEISPRGPFTVLVQSRTPPDWSQLPEDYLATGHLQPNPATTPMQKWLSALSPQAAFRFRLVANPTRDIKVPGEGGIAKEKRVELRGVESWYDWLLRKGELHGFRTLQCQTAPVPNAAIGHLSRLQGRRKGARLTIATVRFDGMLKVTDVPRFQEALTGGIGRAKAYGCGLLSVAPIEI